MRQCEACGQPFAQSAAGCTHCGQPVAVTAAAGHLSRVNIAGNPGPSVYTFPRGPLPATPVSAAGPDEPSSPSSPDWDPDATTRFTPIYASHSRAKNNAALVMLALALTASVGSLAWLIGQTVAVGRSVPQATAAASPTATKQNTAVPRNSTMCSPEVVRSDNTNCTLARRVLAAVRTLGTDLPPTFRVTVTDPQTNKNVTLVCSVKGWIECRTGEVTIYVRH
jgi:hypothetical protein